MQSIARILLSAFLFVLAPSAQSQNAPAPVPPKGAVFVVTYIDVALASIPQTIALLRQYHDEIAENGNPNVDLYQELDRSDRFAIMEQWQDRAAYESQNRNAAAAKLLAALKQLQTAPPDSRVFQGYSVGPARPPGGGRAKIYGISHFEIAAARLAAFGALAKPYVDAARTDPGGMRFDILQGMNPRQNQFAIFESWSNPQDFEAHRTSAAAEKFRDGVAPIATGPFDDRFYGKFN